MAKSDGRRVVSHKACRQCRTGKICKVLERELARFESNLQSKAAKAYIGIENLGPLELEDIVDREIEKAELQAKLERYALHPIYVDVVLYRVVHNWNYAEIAEALNIVSWQQARLMFDQAIELLRERGYK